MTGILLRLRIRMATWLHVKFYALDSFSSYLETPPCFPLESGVAVQIPTLTRFLFSGRNLLSLSGKSPSL